MRIRFRCCAALLGLLVLAGCSKVPSVYKVDFDTTKGPFVVEVHRDWAPIGAGRFYELVKSGFFDNSRFFRVLPGFMVQFGLAANPADNAKWPNLEDDPVTQSNKPGYISFATAGPGTRTSQVFINYGDNARLDQTGFSPFGQVISGMNVVQSLYSGYGEGAPGGNGPDQGRIKAQGNAYVEREFPRLDYIKSAKLEDGK